jgi:uncharacterized protein (TIGR02246 family)
MIAAMLMLLVASVAFGQATNQKPNNGSNAAASSVAEAIIAREKQVTDALMKKDAKAFNSLVASDGMLNTAQGRMSVADMSKVMFSSDYSLTNATVEDPQVVMIDKDAAILTYKTTGTETYQGHTDTSTAYATTIWVKRGGDWKAIFHQESMMPPAPAK